MEMRANQRWQTGIGLSTYASIDLNYNQNDCRSDMHCWRFGCPIESSTLKINGTEIVDTFAEAFSMQYARLIVTAVNERWLRVAMSDFCGYGSSVIGCDAEVGVEGWLDPGQTLDQRSGASALAFGFSTEALGKALANRAGQCLLTCPTTAVFDGLPQPAPEQVALGSYLRFFGDGFQKSKLLGERRFWRIPTMDGEFIIEESAGVSRGVAGGNFLIQSVDQIGGLQAAERAIAAIDGVPGVITPFPGGVVRSGSKVGSRYPELRASTSHTYCPTLRGRVESELVEGANCVYEIVIDGIDFDAVAAAIRKGIEAAAGDGIIAISAGNYGGKLGKHHFQLHQILGDAD
jgi:formylmethanofuran--tetrahydromethanopterin N-formyltransferase